MATIAVPADITRRWYVDSGVRVFPIIQHLDSQHLFEYRDFMGVLTRRPWMFDEVSAHLLSTDVWIGIGHDDVKPSPVFVKFSAPVREITGELSVGFVVSIEAIAAVDPTTATLKLF